MSFLLCLCGESCLKKREEIATIKLPDLNTKQVSSAMRIVEGTARNMGISIVE